MYVAPFAWKVSGSTRVGDTLHTARGDGGVAIGGGKSMLLL